MIDTIYHLNNERIGEELDLIIDLKEILTQKLKEEELEEKI